MDPVEIITENFRVTSQQYFRAEAFHLARKLFWGIIILILVIVIASCFNILFIYLGLILFLVVIPPIIAFIYFSKLLTIEAQKNLAEKRLIINPQESITVEFIENKLESIIINWSDISTIRCNGDFAQIRDRNGKLLLLIPKMFITSYNCFDEFSNNMSWEEGKE